MRTALLTVLPMLAAAILVIVGGERLARRDVEARTPTDRERLFDFSDSLRTEIERLDTLYQNHLSQLSREIGYLEGDHLKSSAQSLAGVRLIRIFPAKGKAQTIDVHLDNSLPEIEIKGGKRPLNFERALIIDPTYLNEPLSAKNNWLTLPEPQYRAYCFQPKAGSLAVILIDLSIVQARADTHLTEWINSPITPLKEAQERINIERTGGTDLTTIGPDRHGPASAIIPIRTRLGEWQIKAWDGISTSTTHDSTTLAVASILALLLAAAGPWLFIEQKRAVKLAADRVSFVNRASHELGTPLTNVLLNLDLATRFLSKKPQEARSRLGLVTEEVERLGRLVANILTFSRSERDTLTLNPERCIPANIIEQTLESFRPALERRYIVIDTTLSAPVAAFLDPDALSQITGNLISNVEKYASSGKSLNLLCEINNEQLTLEVRDKGKGIPRSQKETIFAPFERISSRTNEGSSGTGLGLSIARDLAQRMGGSLELLDSTEGSTFRLTIPAPSTLAVIPDSQIAI